MCRDRARSGRQTCRCDLSEASYRLCQGPLRARSRHKAAPTGVVLLDQAEFLGQCLVVSHLLLHIAVQLFAGHGEREQFALVSQLGEVL